MLTNPNNPITYDLVWPTCRWKPFLANAAVFEALIKRLDIICRQQGWELLSSGQSSGCLLTLRIAVEPDTSAYTVQNTLKRLTARTIRRHSKLASRLPSVWTRGYHAQTVGSGFMLNGEELAEAIKHLGGTYVVRAQRI